MPSKSKSQQRFFGMVDAYKKGELKNPSEKIKKAADGMTKKEVKDFASTKHKGLPEEVGENKVRIKESYLKKVVREAVSRVLREGSADRMDAERWDNVKQMIGAETMLDELYNYLDVDNITGFIEHIDKNYELGIFDNELY